MSPNGSPRFAGDNLVARLGGDEFAGLLASPTVDRRWIEHATRRLCETARRADPAERVQRPGHRLRRARPGTGPAQLTDALSRADAAMYQAKSLGGARPPGNWSTAPTSRSAEPAAPASGPPVGTRRLSTCLAPDAGYAGRVSVAPAGERTTVTNIRALVLNCTLKRSPAPSSAEVLGREVLDALAEQGVAGELVRVVDHDVRFGVSTDEGDGDGWPAMRAS